VIGPPRCRRCLTAGLVFSALLHGATALWLTGFATSAQPPETRALELDLAMFAAAQPPGSSASGAGAAESQQDPPTADPQVAAETTPEPPPDIAEAADPKDTAEPEPVPEPIPEPVPEPELPTPTAEPLPTPPLPTLAKVEPPREPAAKPRPKPRTQSERPVKKPQPRAVRKPLDDPAERKAKREPIVADKTKERPSPLIGSHSMQAPTTSNPPVGSGRAASTGTAPSVAGGGTARGSASNRDAERAYLAQLQRAIGRHQRFPDDARKRHKTGIVTIAFVVKADGRIGDIRLAESSGDPSLDDAALQALHRLNRFKPIPAAIGRQSWSMRVPIRFDLR